MDNMPPNPATLEAHPSAGEIRDLHPTHPPTHWRVRLIAVAISLFPRNRKRQPRRRSRIQLQPPLLREMRGRGRDLPGPSRPDAPSAATDGDWPESPPARLDRCGRFLPGSSRPEAPAVVTPGTQTLQPRRRCANTHWAARCYFRERHPEAGKLTTQAGRTHNWRPIRKQRLRRPRIGDCLI